MPTLKPQSNGPLYSNTVIGTLAVVTFGTERGAWACWGPAPPHCTNETAHPSTASVPTLSYLMWHYNCLWTLKG